ncbi:MAG: YbaN family protein [Alteromonadaceae bacterium]|nr:YbaN family protein [Alteromonadaceae bacterium]
MFYKIVGIFFVGLAVLGVVLPILPTTPFLLVAAGCFAKSSPRLHQKLLDNKVFGPMILDWQQHRTIPLKAKCIALTTIVLSVAWTCFVLNNIYIQATVVLLVLGPFIFLLRLPLSKTNTSE